MQIGFPYLEVCITFNQISPICDYTTSEVTKMHQNIDIDFIMTSRVKHYVYGKF